MVVTLIVDGVVFFFFQAEDGIRDIGVTGVQTVLFRSPKKKLIWKVSFFSSPGQRP